MKKFWIRSLVSNVKNATLRFWLRLQGYEIGSNVIIERGYNFDRLFKSHISIGDSTLVASNVTILNHEHIFRDSDDNPLLKPVVIGKRCFIGVGAIILPGVRIGDDVVVGAGAVVTKNLESGGIYVGNPAKRVRSGIKMNNRAIIISKA